jgi:hypothetical protein
VSSSASSFDQSRTMRRCFLVESYGLSFAQELPALFFDWSVAIGLFPDTARAPKFVVVLDVHVAPLHV